VVIVLWAGDTLSEKPPKIDPRALLMLRFAGVHRVAGTWQ
jgi:hypothetical protein